MTTTSFRSRLVGLAAATLITCAATTAALVSTATAPAFAAPSVDLTQLSLNVSSHTVTQGTAFTADAVVTLADTAPVGTVTIVVDGPGAELTEASQHVTSNTTVAVSITDAPVGTVTVHAHFTPDRAIDQSSANAYQTVTVAKKLTPGGTVSLSTTNLVAGRSNAVVATVTTPVATTSFGGAVHLEVGTTADAAVCTPTPVTSTRAQCTLNVPAFAVGTKPANVSWNGSPDFVEADFTTSLVFTAAPAPAPKSVSHSTASSSTAKPAAAPSAAASPAASATPSATPTTSPSSTKAPTPSVSATPGSIAARTADAVSPLPMLYIVLGVVALLLIAGVVALILVTRRRAAR